MTRAVWAGFAALILFIAYLNRADIAASWAASETIIGPTQDRLKVEAGCETAIKAQLASPGTAKFPGLFNPDRPKAIFYDDHTWRYTVPVDAQNGFGATLRYTFACTLDDKSGAISLEPM